MTPWVHCTAIEYRAAALCCLNRCKYNVQMRADHKQYNTCWVLSNRTTGHNQTNEHTDCVKTSCLFFYNIPILMPDWLQHKDSWLFLVTLALWTQVSTTYEIQYEIQYLILYGAEHKVYNGLTFPCSSSIELLATSETAEIARASIGAPILRNTICSYCFIHADFIF